MHDNVLYRLKQRLRTSKRIALESLNFTLGSVYPQHWEAVEGAASHASQEPAT